MTLLAPRLLITLRREYYAHIPGVDLGTAIVPGVERPDLTWNVHRPGEQVATYDSKEVHWSTTEYEESVPLQHIGLVDSEATLYMGDWASKSQRGVYTHVRSVTENAIQYPWDINDKNERRPMLSG